MASYLLLWSKFEMHKKISNSKTSLKPECIPSMKTLNIPLSITSLALGLSLVGNAHAEVYGLSYNNIFNAAITPDNTNVSFDFVNFPPPNSASLAVLNGSSASFGGAGFTDAPVVNAPGSTLLRSNNSFTPLAQTGTYSNADALIVGQQNRAASTRLKAVTIAEGRLAGVGSTTSSANGTNSSATQYQIVFNVAPAGGALTLDFNADPYLKVVLGPGTNSGSKAEASLSMSIAIKDSEGNTVFSWAPNGAPGGIVGGTEVADEADLNLSISQPLPGSTLFDPTGDASFGSGLTLLSNHFNAVTNTLAQGAYTLTFAMASDHALINNVPEPATLLLMGVGLMGLSFGQRRKKILPPGGTMSGSACPDVLGTR